MSRYMSTVALATLMLATGPAVQAATDATNDATSVTDARISLVQAVTAAERQVGGRAARAEYERTDDGWAYDVEVVDGQRVMDVRVNPTNGTVIGSTVDAPDRDDAFDARDCAAGGAPRDLRRRRGSGGCSRLARTRVLTRNSCGVAACRPPLEVQRQ